MSRARRNGSRTFSVSLLSTLSDASSELIEPVAYLALPIFLAIWFAGYLWKRTLPWKASEIDLDTGRKSWLTVEEMKAYKAQRRLAPWYVKVYRIIFTSS